MSDNTAPNTNQTADQASNATGKDSTNVAGREGTGLGMTEKLAGATKDPINKALGGDNTKAKGEGEGEGATGTTNLRRNY